MDGIPRIGRCVGCQQSARLVRGACGECRGRFGEGCGPVMEEVRRRPEFARMCYRALRTNRTRERFVQMFGDPESKTGRAAAVLSPGCLSGWWTPIRPLDSQYRRP